MTDIGDLVAKLDALIEILRAQIDQRDNPERQWVELSMRVEDAEGLLATISALTTRAEAAEREVIRLTDTGVRADERREMQKAVAEAQAAEERTKRAEARVAELTAALSDLCDEQNGPPLLRDADSWQAAMNNAWRVLGRALEGTR